jgi:hypothetical protein
MSEEQSLENNLPPEPPPPPPPQPLPYLTTEERAEVMAELMRQESVLHDPVGINKQSYRDVIDAVDTWISENMLAVESYIPEPGRSSLTMTQKARIFFAVTRAKIGSF